MRLWKRPSKRRAKRMSLRQQKKFRVGVYTWPTAELECLAPDFETVISAEFSDWMLQQYEACGFYGMISYKWDDEYDGKVILNLDVEVASHPLEFKIKIHELLCAMRKLKPFKNAKFTKCRILDAMWIDPEIIYMDWKEFSEL